MKRAITLVLVALMTSISVMAMSTSKIRTNARFLADRMAYELDLTPSQYDDCYEINYDFIYSINYIMDDVVSGYTDAIDTYYHYLDLRNEDLRYVLNASQYSRFMSLEYFFRPIYSTGRDWAFRIYTIYSNRTFFYYDAPSMYRSYAGGHGRSNYSNGYYNNRYNGMDHYNGTGQRMAGNTKQNARRGDFGTNLKERNNPTQNRQNDYSNKNEKNRTQNQNYRDNSNNQNAPAINNRNGMNGGNQNGQAQQQRQNGDQNGNAQQQRQNGNQNGNAQQQNNSRSQGTTNGRGQGNAQQQNNSRSQGTTSSRGQGNAQQNNSRANDGSANRTVQNGRR